MVRTFVCKYIKLNYFVLLQPFLRERKKGRKENKVGGKTKQTQNLKRKEKGERKIFYNSTKKKILIKLRL